MVGRIIWNVLKFAQSIEYNGFSWRIHKPFLSNDIAVGRLISVNGALFGDKKRLQTLLNSHVIRAKNTASITLLPLRQIITHHVEILMPKKIFQY